MKDHERYLSEIGIKSTPLLAKLTTSYNICSGACPEEINEVFVSEYMTSENSKIYEGMFLFSENFIIEIKNPFDKEIHWDISSYSKCIRWIELKSDNFDFETVDIDSKLTLQFKYNDDYYGLMKATGTNCLHLWQIYQERFKTNLWKQI